MTVAYLWFNAAIYLVFGLWCTLQHGKTTQTQGFLSLDNNGRCEYLTVYGGMELGFAAFYVACALRPEFRGAGILFSLCIYAGIVAYRLTSLALFSNISTTTKAIAGLELALFACAVLLFIKTGE